MSGTRGQEEKRCFDVLIDSMFAPDIFSGKTAFDVDDEEFQKDSLCFLNANTNNYCFGYSEQDMLALNHFLRKLTPNCQPSRFPDFLCTEGLIEHFRVTSSRETNKGAKIKIETADANRQLEQKIQESIKNNSNKPVYVEKQHSYHTYEYFKESFKDNWENHIQHLDDFCGNKNHVGFLIQYEDGALKLNRKYPNFILNTSYGDLLQRENNSYRLSRDKELLRFIYNYKDKVHFVVFESFCGMRNCDIEIIDVSKIPNIIQLIPYDYEFHTVQLFSLGTAAPIFTLQGDDTNDKT